MPKHIKDGVGYSGVPTGAGNLFYDDTETQLGVNTVQGAIEQLNLKSCEYDFVVEGTTLYITKREV